MNEMRAHKTEDERITANEASLAGIQARLDVIEGGVSAQLRHGIPTHYLQPLSIPVLGIGATFQPLAAGGMPLALHQCENHETSDDKDNAEDTCFWVYALLGSFKVTIIRADGSTFEVVVKPDHPVHICGNYKSVSIHGEEGDTSRPQNTGGILPG